jgi:hypothetical protein
VIEKFVIFNYLIYCISRVYQEFFRRFPQFKVKEFNIKSSGIYYLSRDFKVLEVKRQYVDIKISNITYHRNWFPFLKGTIHNEIVFKSDQLTYMTYPRGLVVYISQDNFVLYGGNWLTDDLSIRILKEFGYEEKTEYKQVIVDDYHKYLKECKIKT